MPVRPFHHGVQGGRGAEQQGNTKGERERYEGGKHRRKNMMGMEMGGDGRMDGVGVRER